MKSVAISIENKVRELDGKLWLALNLIDRGYEVTIGPSWEIKPSLEEINPDVYFAKDVGDGNIEFFKSLRNAGIAVCGIPPETGVNSSVDSFIENRKDILHYMDAYFAWGHIPKTAFQSHYERSLLKSKVKITGNPRFDLVTKNLRSFYKKSAEELNKQYCDYLLINTNFGLANPAGSREDTYSKQKELYPDIDPYYEGIRGSRVLYSFIELVFYLLSNDIEENIVIRPHPGEDHSTYQNIFEPFDDVYVRHYGDVRSWIAASSGVLHYDCTTGIEAALMETPVLSYQAVDLELDPKPLSQILSHEVASRDGVLSWLYNYRTANENYTMSPEQVKEAKGFFPNIDELAAPKICDIVDSLEPVSGSSDRYDNTLRQKTELSVRSSRFGSDIIRLYDSLQDHLTDGDHKPARAKRQQKFSGLSGEELAEKVHLFADYTKSDSLTIDPIPKTRYTYNISRK
jgi:surface carbohydrate biosynthesis protein